MSLQVNENNAVLVPSESESKLVTYLRKTDIFKYVPVPKLYPVSTTCSRIGSIFLIIFLLGFFFYTMYGFFAKNVLVTNAFPVKTQGYYQMNNLSFQLQYFSPIRPGSSRYSSSVLNNQSIATLSLYAVYPGGSVDIPLKPCFSSLCPDINYLKEYEKSNPGMGVSLVSANDQLLLYYQNSQLRIRYTLLVQICQYDPSCLPFQNITQIMQTTVLIVQIYEAKGYNYLTGEPINFQQYYYQYRLSTSTNNLVQLTFQQTIFRYLPNLLTTFKERDTSQCKMNEEIAFVNPYPSSTIAKIRFIPDPTTIIVSIAPTTIIETLSLWFSFNKMILTAGLIIFVGWNRKKFDKVNPQWNRFQNIFNAPKKEQQQKEFEMYDINTKGKEDADQSNSDRLNLRENLNGDEKVERIV